MAVTLGRQQSPSAWGPNKKEAEQKAARLALIAMELIEDEAEDEGDAR